MSNIQRAIFSWYDQNKRELPWRNSKNPYHIWLSEIVLQQTRVAQGLPYYNRLIDRFPSVFDLAGATEEDVLVAWKGLGYYSRARNLHKTAKIIALDMKGDFPSSFKDWLLLPGIGKYTAAAIASICLNEKVPAIDGNLIRIISRLYDVNDSIDSVVGKAIIQNFAEDLVLSNRPGDFNQALMDLGSMVCFPKKPDCGNCPLAEFCTSRAMGTQEIRPQKQIKKKAKNRYLVFIFEEKKGKIKLIKQPKGGIWENLYILPILEFTTESSWREFIQQSNPVLSSNEVHVLTHQRLNFNVIVSNSFQHFEGERWVSLDQIDAVPAPILLTRILSKIKSR
jgi:A/G-specific adenine glycosylase